MNRVTEAPATRAGGGRGEFHDVGSISGPLVLWARLRAGCCRDRPGSCRRRLFDHDRADRANPAHGGHSPGPPVAVDVASLPGRWGLASYHDAKDRTRTEAEARRACGNAYVIASGPQGGVLMHLPDQTQVSEVFVKTSPDGRSFIGRAAPRE